MNHLDFREMKRKKERGVSNEEFMDKSKEFFKDADSIIVVGMDKDGFINTFYTQLSSTQVIGMVEIAKQQLIQETEV
ncbi:MULTISPECIES: hypothetical protein [Enterococcus]|nr:MULTISPECIES: hypothetical protein [Enterococcus]MCD5192412.1 hypothetical protein [Enterococcus casseliflavus]MDO0919888.1 hypothetical protein [Enterococcus sp. B1E2]NKD29771.1 hypothetical protein [Enterococcus casseliflavus]WIV14310.1 hypothetical protein QN079_09980 [Enterococcus sp. FZMF]